MSKVTADHHVGICDVGVICALGSGSRALHAALSTDRRETLSMTSPFWPDPLPQGLVIDPLPSLEGWPLEYRTRCNAILLACFRQVEGRVAAAVARFGAHRVAIILGTSTSGIGEAQSAFERRVAEGVLPDDFCLEQQGLGGPADFLGRVSGIRGACYSISTACTSAPKAMASAVRLIRAGMADVVIAGGVDALNRYTLAGFSALECVSQRPCNPMSVNRDGINMGEGAALFVLSRDAAEVSLVGWGESSDAYHVSSPDPGGAGAALAMQAALRMAGLEPADIDYINLHGTATIQNDAMESHAVASLFGTRVPCSSTKPLTGHALGAAGAIEAALCWHVLRGAQGCALPPHWWDGEADPSLPVLNLVTPGAGSIGRPRRALSNSFAFGGSNAALVLERTYGG